jgi:hypothetical protein
VFRLLYLEQADLLPWLVTEKGPARQEWRRQHGVPANRRAAGEPAFFSVGDVAAASNVKFAGLVAAAATQQRGKPVNSNSIKPDIAAFLEGLYYDHYYGYCYTDNDDDYLDESDEVAARNALRAEAEQLERKLRSQLPPELLADK